MPFDIRRSWFMHQCASLSGASIASARWFLFGPLYFCKSHFCWGWWTMTAFSEIRSHFPLEGVFAMNTSNHLLTDYRYLFNFMMMIHFQWVSFCLSNSFLRSPRGVRECLRSGVVHFWESTSSSASVTLPTLPLWVGCDPVSLQPPQVASTHPKTFAWTSLHFVHFALLQNSVRTYGPQVSGPNRGGR